MTDRTLGTVGKRARAMLAALATAAMACAAAADEAVDLVVNAGETRTLSTSGTWKSITVNGTLTIDSGAVITVDDGSEWHNAIVKVGDGAGAGGTVKAGALAASGTLDIDAETLPRGAFALPLTLDGTTLPTTMAGWTVTLNGAPTNRRLICQDGKLLLLSPGMAVIFR